jgi:hypothetical protein
MRLCRLIDSQGNSLTIPPHLAEQINASQEEEVDPESLLLPEMYTRYVRGELNSIEDVRNTYETLMGQSFASRKISCMTSVSGSCIALIPSA